MKAGREPKFLNGIGLGNARILGDVEGASDTAQRRLVSAVIPPIVGLFETRITRPSTVQIQAYNSQLLWRSKQSEYLNNVIYSSQISLTYLAAKL